MRINIIKLLEFFDVYKPAMAVHVTALNSFLGADLVLGIARHYFESLNCECRISTANPVSVSSRHRLDRWLTVSCNGLRVFYQTEVKNWTVYTQGVPQTLSPGMSARELNRYAYSMYKKQWNDKTGTFIDHENLSKVLKPMQPPEGYDETADIIRPLVCYWYPISGSARLKLASHFFTVQCSGDYFNEADIFSVSLYLRHIAAKAITQIDINPGRFIETLNYLKVLIQF